MSEDSNPLLAEMRLQGRRLDMLRREVRTGFAITLVVVLLGAITAYVGIIQTERIQRAAEAYSDYLTAIADRQCEQIARAKARIAAHGSRNAVAAVAAFTECSPCSSADTQNLLIDAVEAIQDHMRPFSEATAAKDDIRRIFCATR